MPVHTLPADTDRLRSALKTLTHEAAESNRYLVVCYCAQWCDTCREYAHGFADLAQQWPQHIFVWVDIEESPELLGDEDVENFPTLLVQSDGKNLFFGPMLPHIGHLDKLLETAHRMPPTSNGPPPLTTLI